MFIYATAHSLANAKKNSYCLSNLDELKYFKLKKFEKNYNFIKYTYFRISSKLFKYNFHHFQDNRFDYSQKMLSILDRNNWFYGYFQGVKYFFNNQNEIKKRFTVKNIYSEEFKKIKNKICINEDYTIVHIRLKDYKTFGPDYLGGPDLTLPFSYYHNIIKTKIEKNQKIIFLSDDISTVKEEFKYVENAYFSKNKVIIDFQFILNAKTCVLSCSTFSWWGAWLNNNIYKKIYVPKYFLGHKVKKEYPINIIPKNWIQIET